MSTSTRNLVRCPQCDNVVGESEGERITVLVAVRGRNRRQITSWRQAEFACERCGTIFLYEAGVGKVHLPPTPTEVTS